MKHLFIDMDGVIADYVNINTNKAIINDYNVPGIFLQKEPCQTMIKSIINLFPKEKYCYHILSASPTEMGIEEKNQWLDKYFNIEDRYFVKYPDESKAKFISEWCYLGNVNIEDCYLIDDTQRHLKEFELVGGNPIHPIHILVLNERNI
jgi:hypothetical protein